MDLQNRAEAGSDGHDESVLNPEMPQASASEHAGSFFIKNKIISEEIINILQ